MDFIFKSDVSMNVLDCAIFLSHEYIPIMANFSQSLPWGVLFKVMCFNEKELLKFVSFFQHDWALVVV